jgi:2-methylcitrate dehydratase PrpD
VFVDQFTEAMVDDRARIDLSHKVEVVEDPAITARGARFRHMVRVALHLKGGAVEEETVEAPRGSEQKFASEADVVSKFRKLARSTMADQDADRVVDMTLGCETIADVGLLVDALGRK